jgi:type I restriction enzyme R subunit
VTPKTSGCAKANRIVFTTAQKFEESEDCLSERRNIVVVADEAHRSQFVDERVDSKTGKIQKSLGGVHKYES